MESQGFKQRKDRLQGAVLGCLLAVAVFGLLRLVGTNANTVYSQVGPSDKLEQSMSGSKMEMRLATAGMVSPILSDVLVADSSRKIAQSSSFELIVGKPSEAAEKIRELTERLGGYLVTSQVSGTDTGSASITIRVPVAHAEEAKAEIRKLAIRIESEKTEAEDVTKQWIDTDAHLRNLRATEQQYLQILKRATSVSDTVEVTDKLGEIRGEIEQQQAEFTALSKRVETVAISIQLQPDADVQVFGLRWRPLYRAKLSLREAVDAIGDYSATVFEIIVHIPVILLWLVTLVAFAAIGWRLLRWIARVCFGWKQQPKTQA
jgi:uncharacterized protein DUF4349